MRLRKFILSGVGVLSALLMALAAVAVSTPAASAGTRPLPVIYNQNNGWNNAHVRPHAIYVGNGGAPFIRRMHWTHWSPFTAAGHGRLHEQKPGCTRPSYLCPYMSHRVRVYLHRVRTHLGAGYFSRMRWISHGQRYHWRLRQGFWWPS